MLCGARTMDLSCVWRLLSAADLKLKGLECWMLRLAFCRPQRSLWLKERPVVKFNSVCRFCLAQNQNTQRVLISIRKRGQVLCQQRVLFCKSVSLQMRFRILSSTFH